MKQIITLFIIEMGPSFPIHNMYIAMKFGLIHQQNATCSKRPKIWLNCCPLRVHEYRYILSRCLVSFHQVDILKKFIDEGGCVLLSSAQGGDNQQKPNVNALLQDFGITINSDCLVSSKFRINNTVHDPLLASISN